MTKQDVISAKHQVEVLMQANGCNNVYNGNDFGIYVNWTNKSISLHGPSSSDWKKAQGEPTNMANIFAESPNGLWIGGFGDFAVANTFAELLQTILIYTTHTQICYAYSKGINQPVMKVR